MATFMSAHDDDEEPPLDAAAERLRRKLARLLLVSGGIMFLGLMAVFAAIIYKVGGFSEGGRAQPLARAPAASSQTSFPSAGVEAEIALPADARLIGTALDGERALLTVQSADGQTSLILVELASGKVLGHYALKSK